MLTDEYIKRVYDQVVARDGDQPEFLQTVSSSTPPLARTRADYASTRP